MGVRGDVVAKTRPLTPDPSPPKRGRGEERRPPRAGRRGRHMVFSTPSRARADDDFRGRIRRVRNAATALFALRTRPQRLAAAPRHAAAARRPVRDRRRLPLLQRLPRGQGGGPRRRPGHAGPPLQRRPELPPDQQVGAVRPPLRGHFRGRAADRPGAGDPIRLHAGSVVAGDRRLPGRGGAGHAGAGRVGAPRRQSRWPDRPRRAGPWAYRVTSAAILFIVVIALAGLGFVVVKALGGEEVPSWPRGCGYDARGGFEPGGTAASRTFTSSPAAAKFIYGPTNRRKIDGLPRSRSSSRSRPASRSRRMRAAS